MTFGVLVHGKRSERPKRSGARISEDILHTTNPNPNIPPRYVLGPLLKGRDYNSRRLLVRTAPVQFWIHLVWNQFNQITSLKLRTAKKVYI